MSNKIGWLSHRNGETYSRQVNYVASRVIIKTSSPPACDPRANRDMNEHLGSTKLQTIWSIRPSLLEPQWGKMWKISNVGPPSDVISWFLSPSNYSYLRSINHSYWSYLHQLSYLTGAPHCRIVVLGSLVLCLAALVMIFVIESWSLNSPVFSTARPLLLNTRFISDWRASVNAWVAFCSLRPALMPATVSLVCTAPCWRRFFSRIIAETNPIGSMYAIYGNIYHQ